jgi:hypothetical protein
MKRRVLNALILLSLVLCLATLTIWFITGLYLELSHGGRRYRAASVNGYLSVEVRPDGPLNSHSLGVDDWGLVVVMPIQTDAGRGVVVAVPLWQLTIALAAPPLVWLGHRWRRVRQQQRGHCPVCGYDLRATPERCPECGTVTTVP